MAIVLNEAIAQIARLANNNEVEAEDYEIKLFIETAAELSKLPEMEKKSLLMPLQNYFENKKGKIEEFIASEYGSQARLMANQLHLSVFGRPWKD